MKETLKPGIRFEWQTTVPSRSVVPALYGEHIEFARDMPEVLATGYMVGLMELACTRAIIPHLDWPAEQSLGTSTVSNQPAQQSGIGQLSSTVGGLGNILESLKKFNLA